MANRATVTYNGKTISTEDREGNFNVTYNGSVIATIGAGVTKTLKCAGQVMKTNVIIGGKTLNCAKYKMLTDVIIAVKSLFPSAPSAYNLIGTYTSNQTWTAPENGYFQIELFGASGNGGAAIYNTDTNKGRCAAGGGGGGGGYACSRVTLNKGDTIALAIGAVGSTTSAVVNSSHNNSHVHTLSVTSGANGTDGSVRVVSATEGYQERGYGGAGGTASGGNYSNANGTAGSDGTSGIASGISYTISGGAGGSGSNGAPSGGKGGSVIREGLLSGIVVETGASGSAGFVKIYRGNTN